MNRRDGADGARVLLVDDDAGVRRALRSLLEDEGVVVTGEAADGAQAVGLAAGDPPDVVLMDLRMPRMDGVAATRAIRDRRPDVQVVVVTAYDDVALQVAASRAGAFAYVVKGAGAPTLLDAVARASLVRRQLDRRRAAGA